MLHSHRRGILAWAGVLTITAAAFGAPTPRIDDVFFAQHHVLRPDDPLFKLVGELEALIKVQVYADDPAPSPLVFAVLEQDGRRRELPLLGPASLPRTPAQDPMHLQHAYADSFTAMIPGDWVRPGLKVTVELRSYDYSRVSMDDHDYERETGPWIAVLDRRVIDDLRVGAPNRLTMNMFDIRFFGRGRKGDLPEGWAAEMETKLPVAELRVHRAPPADFNELVMAPGGGRPAIRCGSPEAYEEITGKPFDGEQGMALRWGRALKRAGGLDPGWRLVHVNICGVHAGGQAAGLGNLLSCGSVHRHGVILHEVGHALGLPHWAQSRSYPYRGDKEPSGRSTDPDGVPHAGPTWAFDLHRRAFIPPTVDNGGEVWKRDPMHGGGQGDQGPTYLYRHFSDYSMARMQGLLERRLVCWDETNARYARWNDETGAYDEVLENDGMQLPLERDADVVSVLVGVSGVTPEANIIYAPIGPYRGGLVRLLEADSEKDRADAAGLGFTEETCNVALRVTQGGRTKTYLLLAAVDPGDDPLNGGSYHTVALNLPATAGEITSAEVLYAPGVTVRGVTPDARILARWGRSDALAPTR